MLPPRQQHEDLNDAVNAPMERMPDVTQQPEIDLLNLSQNTAARNLNAAPKEPSFDLLGSFEAAEAQGNNTMPDLLSDSQTKPPGLDEIFGSFSRTAAAAAASSNPSSSVLPDLNNIGLDFNAFGGSNENRNVPRNQNNQQFDPFGNASFVGNVDVLQPTSRETSPQQAQQPPFPAASSNNNSRDPFADIANLASGLNLNWKAQQGTSAPRSTPGVSPNTTQFPSPTHQQPSASPMHQAKSPMNGQPTRPDYSRSNFDVKSKQNGSANASATAPSAAAATAGPSGVGVGGGGADIFADILGQQGYSFAAKPNQGPRSINEMRKEEMVKDMDPDKLKILEWVSRRFVRIQNSIKFMSAPPCPNRIE